VARALGYSDSKVSRKITACLQKLKTETLAYIESVDPYYDFAWEDLAKIAHEFLNGQENGPPAEDEDSDYDLDLDEEKNKRGNDENGNNKK